MGPSAIRYAGLEERLAALGVNCIDRGNVATAVAEATTEHDPRARFLPAIRATCERIAGLVGAALEEDRVPIVLGGDHSIALGTLGGLASRRGPGAVLWFDAHGDLNTVESSPTGNLWATPLRMLIDSGAVGAEDVVLVGARSLDAPEQEFIAAAGVRVGADGLAPALAETEGTYVALDGDAIEPGQLDVFMPEPGGLSLDDAEAMLRQVAGRAPVLGLGYSGLGPGERNVEPLTRLAAALGL
jgi:arginase